MGFIDYELSKMVDDIEKEKNEKLFDGEDDEKEEEE